MKLRQNRFCAILSAPLGTTLALSLLVTISGQVRAASGTVNATGYATSSWNWSDPTMWTSGIVSGTTAGDVVGMSGNWTNNTTVTIDTTPRTAGILNVSDTASTFRTFTLAASGGAALTFDNGVSNAQLNAPTAANTATITIGAPILLNSNLDIANSSTAGSVLTLSTGGITAGTSGTKTITNKGTGTAGVTISGVIGNGAGTVALVQNSTSSALTLSGANTFSGGATLSAGTVLVGASSVNSGTSITSGPFGTGNLTLNNGVTLASSSTNGWSIAAPVINLAGNITLAQASGGTGRLSMDGTWDLGGASRAITLGKASTNYASGNEVFRFEQLAGFSIPTVQNAGAGGALTLTTTTGSTATPSIGRIISVTNFAGNTGLTLDDGVAFSSGNGAFFGSAANAPALTLNVAVSRGGGILQLADGISGSTAVMRGAELFSLSGGGSVKSDNTGAATVAATGTLTINHGNGAIFSGSITESTYGKIAVTKSGPGIQTFTGTNSYTGATAVSGGTLALGGGGNLGATAVTVSSGATLAVVPGVASASNTVSTASLTLNSGSFFSMADGVTSTAAVTGAATLNGKTTFEVGASTNDMLTVSGTSTGTPTVALLPMAGASYTAGTNYTLITAAGGLPTTGVTFLGNVPLSGGGVGHFTLAGTTSATSLVATLATGTPSSAYQAYWQGGLSSAPASWKAQNASPDYLTNFSQDAAGAYNTYALPGANTTVILTANSATNLSTTLDQAFSISGLVFSGTGTSDTTGSNIASGTGTNALTLNGGGITVNAGSGANTISANITLGAAQAWTNNSGGTLTVGNISNSGNTLTVSGAGNTAIGGTYGTGSGGLTKTGAGTLTLSNLSGTAASNYTGTTVIDQGTLAITTTSPTLTGALTFGASSGSTSVGTLDLGSASATFNGTMTVQTNANAANTITIGSGKTLALNGNFSMGTNTQTGYASRLTVSGASGTWNVTKSGGTITVGTASSANCYDVAIVDLGGLGTFNANLGSTGVFRIGHTGSGSGSVPSYVILAPTSAITTGTLGIGDASGTGQNMALYLGSGTQAINANTIYVGLNNGSNQRSSGVLQFNGSSGTVTVRAADGSSAANLYLGQNTSTTSGPTSSRFDVTGHTADLKLGDLKMASRNGANASVQTQTDTFKFDTGTLTVANQAILANNVGTTTVNSGNNAVMILGGGSAGTGAATFTSGLSLAQNSSTGTTGTTATATLTIQGNGAYAFGVTSGTITMGTLTGGTNASNQANATLNLLGGSLTMTGDIVAGGTGSGTASQTVTLNGGTLDMGYHNLGTAANPLPAATLNFQSGTLKNVGSINTTGGLTKTTTGTLTLSGTNNYTGGTTVKAGTLVLAASATLANSPLITVGDTGSTGAVLDTTAKTGGFTLLGSQTLKGIGNITGSVVVNGTLAPGASIGTLTASGSVTFAPGSTYALEVGDWTNTTAGTGYDTLATNAVDVTATSGTKLTIHLDASGISNFTESTKSFVIASAASAPTGVASDNWQVTTTGFSGTGTWSLATTGNNLVLTYTPAASGFSSWINTNYPSLSDKTAAGDPDGDGIKNLMEYVLNSNPGASSTASLPTLTSDPTNFIFTYSRRVESASDTTQTFEYTADLSFTDQTPITIPGATPGTFGDITVGSPTGTAPDQVQTITITIPKGTNTKLFGRLKVTQP